MQPAASAMYQAVADMTSNTAVVHCGSGLSGCHCGTVPTIAMPWDRLMATTNRAVRRRLQFDVDDIVHVDDADSQKTSVESSETALDYLERLYDDQMARWSMDFRTVTPLHGGRWQWTAVVTSAADNDVTSDDSGCSTVSRNIVTKKRRSKMNGKCQCCCPSCITADQTLYVIYSGAYARGGRGLPPMAA